MYENRFYYRKKLIIRCLIHSNTNLLRFFFFWFGDFNHQDPIFEICFNFYKINYLCKNKHNFRGVKSRLPGVEKWILTLLYI